MAKFSYSLILALAIHVLILIFFFPFGKESSPIVGVDAASSRNSISLNMASYRESGPKIVSHATKKQDKTLDVSTSLEQNIGTSLSTSTSNDAEAGGSQTNSVANFEEATVSYQRPIYPKLAIRRGLTGTVKVRVKVSLEGLPIEKETLKSSGHAILDQAVMEAVSYWRFQKKNSEYFVEKSIVFQLQ